MNGHRRIEERSLRLHRAVAGKLRRAATVLAKARERVEDWRVEASVHPRYAQALEVHDLVVSKLVAGREKDLEFAREAARHRLVDEEVLRERLSGTQVVAEVQSLVEGRITRLFRPPPGIPY